MGEHNVANERKKNEKNERMNKITHDRMKENKKEQIEK